MEKLKRLIFSLAFSICILSMNPLTVHATAPTLTENTDSGESSDSSGGSSSTGHEAAEDGLVYGTGDAIADIMNNKRFEGAIDSISAITEFTDVWFTRIITFVAFFIISAAMLKNVCAGAYCANSKFWDKVAEAHQKSEAVTLAGMKDAFKNVGNTSVGGLRDAFLGIIPNIKAWTDFDDADIEPKAYFMKAIPQMLGCIIIGIFIYNGYYRDTAATVGSMGSEIIERTLGSVNPESFINKIFNTTGWPDWPTKNDTSLQGQTEYAICKELQSLVASEFSDVDSTQEKAQFVANAASYVRDHTAGSFDKFYNVGDAKYSYQISSVKSFATAKGVYTEELGLAPEDNNGNVAFTFVINDPVSTLGLASTKGHDGNSAFVVSGMFKYVAKSDNKGKSTVVTEGWQGEDGVSVNVNSSTPIRFDSGQLSVTDGKATLSNATFKVSDCVSASDLSKVTWGNFDVDGQPSGTTVRIDGNGSVTVNGTFTINNNTINLGRLNYRSKYIGDLVIQPMAGS